MTVQFDGKLDIATGRDRHTRTWQNKSILWSRLLTRLSKTHRTAETFAEYLAAKPARQAEIKDVGGFVGGFLTDGRRKNDSVKHRQLVCLDADYALADFWERFTLLHGCAACIYSTHKHSPEAPRLRLLIPLNRPVSPAEYKAIARKVAESVGIDYFDHTGFRGAQLMYWPSTAKDGEYIFEYQDGPWLSADDILASYPDWRDSSAWPMSSREKDIPRREIQKQGDPLSKEGTIGAFCRAYSVPEAIETFLSDVYEPTDQPDRYTYKSGTTAGGLVVYEDKFAYSHHSTDPAEGKLCNAFDLVRLHRFGHMDADTEKETPGTSLPSFKAMMEFAAADPNVSRIILEEVFSGDLESKDPGASLLELYRIRAEDDILDAEILARMGDAPIAGRGQVSVISGIVKGGKSAVISQLIAAALRGVQPSDTFSGLDVVPANGQAVIHIDTEQHPADTRYQVRSCCRIAGLDRTPVNLYTYNSRSLTPKKMLAFLQAILPLIYAESGGIHSVFIDGGADFANDTNDNTESAAVVREFISLADKYNAAFYIVVHTNPSGEKERGHFGSELQRKCYALLTVTRKDDVSCLSPKLMRKGGFAQAPAIFFTYDTEKGYHVEAGNPDREKYREDERELKALANTLIEPGEEIKHADLCWKIEERKGVSNATARKRVAEMLKAGILEKTGSGKFDPYRLNDSNAKRQRNANETLTTPLKANATTPSMYIGG